MLLVSSSELQHRCNSGVERDIYTIMCIRAVCAVARQITSALDACTAGHATGIQMKPWCLL